tara:strand:+ start:61 stop:168 length:108 start_codon:yes stop_codon:yes gene_type:complete
MRFKFYCNLRVSALPTRRHACERPGGWLDAYDVLV